MPSPSQPTSRQSSSRRRSSRGGKSRGKKNSLQKTVAQNGINFWAMLAGLVCGLTVLLLIINIFTKDRINPDLLASNDQNRAEVATRVRKQDFDTFVAQASADKLAETLISLQEVPTFKTPAAFRTNYERQQKTIDAMSDQTLSKEHRRLIVLANLKVTATAFWTDKKKPLGLANLEIRLRELTELHKDSSDPEIAFQARVKLARLNSLVAADMAIPHAKELHQLLADFPTNKEVHGVITESLQALVSSSEKREMTTKLLSHFLDQPRADGDQTTQNLYLLLTDLWILCDHKFFEVQENLLYTSQAGRDQMREVCLALAKAPTAGIEVAGHLERTAKWMERKGHYAHATSIYEALQTAGARLPSEKSVTETQQKSEWGIKRCNTVGKQFELATNTFDGKPLNPQSFKSMPVLIVFWSDTDNTELVLSEVENASERWQKDSVKIIAVQVEKDPSLFSRESTKHKMEQYNTWEFCYDDGTGDGPIFSQVPDTENGRVVLLDRQHRLYNLNVNREELVTTVKKLLAIRNPSKK